MGWGTDHVAYYRAQLRAPCQTEFDQDMRINRPGTSDASYKINRLKAGINSASIWVERAGVVVSKSY